MKKITKLEQIAHYTGDVMTTNCTYEFSQAYKDGIISEIDGKLLINAPKGTRIAKKGDYIVKEQDGTFYSYTPEEFASIDMISCIDVDGKQIWVNKNEIYKLILTVEENINNTDNDLFFAKVSPSAKIPTKDDENMGYDIYADFEENFILIQPHETKMIPTGICSACSEDYAIVLKERGSTGTKGIAQRCGVIDSGYRNEWFVPVTNTTDYPLIISKLTDSADILLKKLYGDISPNKITIYPYEKAICQAVVLPVPKMNVKEISLEELKAIPSKRGEGCLGSSGK
jgi:dUTP pyrophosphatase